MPDWEKEETQAGSGVDMKNFLNLPRSSIEKPTPLHPSMQVYRKGQKRIILLRMAI